MREHRILPHGDLVEVATGLWQVQGSLPFPLPRNMTIYRLPGGDLLLYSVVALDEQRMADLERLGRPAVMVVPHRFHVMDAAFYKRRYPDLRVIAVDDARERIPDVHVDAGPADGLGELGIRHHLVPGFRYHEVVLELDLGKAGPALVVTDLLAPGSAPGLLLRLMGPPGNQCGVPRIVKFRQVREKPAVRRFVGELAERTGRGILAFSHGPAFAGDVGSVLREAAARI